MVTLNKQPVRYAENGKGYILDTRQVRNIQYKGSGTYGEVTVKGRKWKVCKDNQNGYWMLIHTI